MIFLQTLFIEVFSGFSQTGAFSSTGKSASLSGSSSAVMLDFGEEVSSLDLRSGRVSVIFSVISLLPMGPEEPTMIGRLLEHEGRELTESQTDGLRHVEDDWLLSGFKSPDVFGRTAVRGLGGPLALAVLSKGAMDSESIKEEEVGDSCIFHLRSKEKGVPRLSLCSREGNPNSIASSNFWGEAR